MLQFAYWKNWQKPYRILFIMLLALLAGSILYFVVSLLFGADFIFGWILNPVLESIQVPLQAWQHPLLEVQVPVNSYVVKQTYWGSPMQVNTTAAAISLVFFLLALSVMLACITTLSRLWYLVSIAAFCALVVLLRLEQLGVLGRFDNSPAAAVFLLILPLTYYFHAIRPSTSFLLRLGAFGGIIVLLALALGYLATVQQPVLYVVNYGLPAWLGLSMLLLILVGPEIIAGILYLVTASTTPNSKGSFRHFAVASSLYLLNLILYYLTEREYLDWDIYFIGPYWILLISIVAGLWTLRLRGESLNAAIQAEPWGLMLYIALACLTLSTLAYAAATANDPLLESFEDAILYTHMGMGAGLLFYIIANFYGLLRENQRVYRIMYRPQLMPLFTARLVGLIIMVALYSVRGNWAYFQVMSGYYNGIGDLYAVQGDLITSQNYYQLGNQYMFRNHRSNYALASLALSAGSEKPAIIFLREATERQATPFAYANLANLYRQRGLFFDAMFTLREGVGEFPLSGQLYNNLGLYYGSTQLTDSAFYFLRAAAGDDASEEVALANMLAVLAQKGIALSPDSLLAWNTPENLALHNNMLAMANRLGYRVRELRDPAKVLGSDSSALKPLYLLNYALQTPRPDTALISKVKQEYEQSQLSPLEEQWGMAYALLLYQQPNYYQAFAVLQDLANRSQFNNITYFKILGQWALEQRAPLLAAEWFEQAYYRGDAAAGFYQALALAEAGKAEDAAAQWINLPDSALNPLMQQKKSVALLALSATPLEALPEQEQQELVAALRLRLRSNTLIPAETSALISAIDNKVTKAEALLFLAETALKANERAQAQTYLAQLQQLRASLSEQQQEAAGALRLRYQLKAGGTGEQDQPFDNLLLNLQQQAGQQLAAGNASKAIELLGQVAAASPFEEGAILQLVNLLNAQKEEEKAYSWLLQALLLNKYSVPLRQAYILQSLQMGLESYAQDALAALKKSAGTERYNSFMEEYQRLQQARENKEVW